MRKVGVEAVGMGALKLTGFLREQMQQQNMYFESLYTVRELKEVNRVLSKDIALLIKVFVRIFKKMILAILSITQL